MKRSVNGVEIAYDDAGQGAPVVLLHGFSLDRRMWRKQIPPLSAAYRVIAPDFRGCGESTGTPSSMDELARDIHALVAGLDAGPAVFGGFSMGGYVLFRYLEMFPADVAAIMLLDTRAEADVPEARERRFASIRRIAAEGPRGFLDDFLRVIVAPATYESRPEVVAELREMMAASSAEALTAALRAMAERPDSVPLLSNITVPALIAVGEEDQATPVAGAGRMHAGIPQSTLIVIPRAGHMSNLEQPERFNDALLRFLETLPSGRRKSRST